VRAVVTGGAGFIGSHVVDALLARGDDVTVIDNFATGKRENLRSEAALAERDIREDLAAVFDDARPEVCFHLAAQADVRVSVADPEFDAQVNAIGTVRVLEGARRHGTHLVFSSTGGAIYGESPEPATEESARQPLSPYGTSKLAAEEYIRTYNRLYESGHVALRYGNVYGPRQDPHGEAGVVAIFFNRLKAGEAPRIFGDGQQTRDYVFVGDVVDATLAGAGVRGGVFNVGTGRETSVVELFDACRAVTGVDVEPDYAPARLGELQRSVLAIDRAIDELAWRPRRSLDEGLAETWNWLVG
jgi:UDP-glucose 4-epimerase